MYCPVCIYVHIYICHLHHALFLGHGSRLPIEAHIRNTSGTHWEHSAHMPFVHTYIRLCILYTRVYALFAPDSLYIRIYASVYAYLRLYIRIGVGLGWGFKYGV
jgi:hypothetical protein